MGVTALLVFATLLTAAHTSAPDTLWTKAYGGTSDDLGRAMQLTSDGGCIIAGYTRSFGAGGSDVWLLKTDSLGETLWTKTYGGSLDDDAYSVGLASDGGYVVVGMTKSFGAGGADVWLLKAAASGDTEWTRTFGDTLDDIGYSVKQTSDGGYVVAADERSPVPPDYATTVCLIKTDSAGDTAWTRSYASGLHPKAVLQTSDRGYTVAARFISGGQEYAWLMRTDSVGDTLWVRRSGSIGLNDIQFRPEGGYILTGVLPGPAVFWLGALDTMGQELWGRYYADGTARSVWPVNGGGYVATGNAYRGRQDVYLVRTDSLGDSLWSTLVGDSFNDYGYAVRQTPDSGLLVLGSTQSFGAGRTDVWLVRFGTEDVGAEESREPQAASLKLPATVLSGLSGFEQLASCDIFDAMGRRIKSPKPGVCFVREGPQAAGRKAQAVRKVVVTR